MFERAATAFRRVVAGQRGGSNGAELSTLAEQVQDVVDAFAVPARVAVVTRGATVARLVLVLDPGVKVERLIALAPTISATLGNPSVRVFSPVPGSPGVGLEIPLPEHLRRIVPLQPIMTHPVVLSSPDRTLIGLGRTVDGQSVIASLAALPHLLIAGATGSGKSEAINSIMVSLLSRARPDQVQFVLIDPKRVELAPYSGIAHLARPVATTGPGATSALAWVEQEIERRYRLLESARVRGFLAYCARSGVEPLARLVVVVDEMADLFAKDGECEASMVSIAQLGRAAGVHLVAATQRPDAKTISGQLKANIPARLAFQVADGTNSRIILDVNGAELLGGRGDGLFRPVGAATPIRIQGALVRDVEIEHWCHRWRAAGAPSVAEPRPAQAVPENQHQQAARMVVAAGSGSVARLRRELNIGHGRASELMSELERAGLVGPIVGSKPRRLLAGQTETEKIIKELGESG